MTDDAMHLNLFTMNFADVRGIYDVYGGDPVTAI